LSERIAEPASTVVTKRLSVRRHYALLGLARSGVSRALPAREDDAAEMRNSSRPSSSATAHATRTATRKKASRWRCSFSSSTSACACRSPTAAPDRCDVHGLFYGSRPPSLRMNPKRVQRLMRLMAFWPLGRSRAGASPATQHKVFPYPFARGFACDITYVRIGTGFFYLVATPSTDAKRAPQSLPGSPSKIVGARFHHPQDPPHELTAGSKPLITAPTPPSNGSIDLLAAA
jgi:hypothetical protein